MLICTLNKNTKQDDNGWEWNYGSLQYCGKRTDSVWKKKISSPRTHVTKRVQTALPCSQALYILKPIPIHPHKSQKAPKNANPTKTLQKFLHIPQKLFLLRSSFLLKKKRRKRPTYKHYSRSVIKNDRRTRPRPASRDNPGSGSGGGVVSSDAGGRSRGSHYRVHSGSFEPSWTFAPPYTPPPPHPIPLLRHWLIHLHLFLHRRARHHPPRQWLSSRRGAFSGDYIGSSLQPHLHLWRRWWFCRIIMSNNMSWVFFLQNDFQSIPTIQFFLFLFLFCNFWIFDQ